MVAFDVSPCIPLACCDGNRRLQRPSGLAEDGPPLLVATALIVAIRTAKWSATIDARNSNSELDKEIDFAAHVALHVLSAVTKLSPSVFPSRNSLGTKPRVKIIRSDRRRVLITHKDCRRTMECRNWRASSPASRLSYNPFLRMHHGDRTQFTAARTAVVVEVDQLLRVAGN